MKKPIDVEGYLNYDGELRVSLRKGRARGDTWLPLVPSLDRAQVLELIADLQAALNMGDTLGDNEGGS